MRATDLVATAISNTFRSKLRTTLTVLAIFVGAFTLTLTTAVGAGVSEYVDAQVGSLGAADVFIVTPKADAAPADAGPVEYDPATSGAATGGGFGGPPGATSALTDADLATISGTDGIKSVDPIRGLAPDYVASGDSTKYEFTINPASGVTTADLTAGAQLDHGASDFQLILPDSYVKPFGFASDSAAVGSTVQIGITDVLGERQSVDATVVGVSLESILASGAGANAALTDELATVQSAGIDTGSARYAGATARFDKDLSPDAVLALQSTLADDGLTARTVADQLGTVQTVINGIVGVLNAFAVIALVAAAFGIINTLLMSVQERTREIGLMKAMGMGGGKVYMLFSLEAIVIGFLGSALGAGVAIAAGSILSNVLSTGLLADLPGLNILLFEPTSVALIILLVMAIAFLSGTLPAQRAAKANPIESLRYE
ncbi:ABC transporter permease [Cryobacterium psychrophilum]|uniref:ABC transporter permease n=1 Tax=Cryobacterium psychrophilum TaxID=41988 RepID=A0A4Y8KT92_9MICO|nr:ABC transporter permease [Cryobacterium psychrophilum]TDW31177.1 putative ABC transport system permease protein [Cryobacterium psychrophilum]TFD78530.1 ABC transporter permease [Cryobacterium psychrophilum]